MKQYLRFLCFAGAMSACLWFGYVHEIAGARRLATAMIWLALVATLGGQLESTRKEFAASKTPIMPEWLRASLSFAIAGFCFWHGAIVSGIVYLVAHSLNAYNCYKILELRAANDSKEPHS
jgi:hypothetical protein